LQELGKYSFTIYLLHIQIIPIVAKFFGSHIVSTLASPVISYAITFGAIWIVCKIANRLRLEKLTKCLLGTRI
jgi:peptidoglycan/LPS O-acetylase OafA/YrhL